MEEAARGDRFKKLAEVEFAWAQRYSATIDGFRREFESTRTELERVLTDEGAISPPGNIPIGLDYIAEHYLGAERRQPQGARVAKKKLTLVAIKGNIVRRLSKYISDGKITVSQDLIQFIENSDHTFRPGTLNRAREISANGVDQTRENLVALVRGKIRKIIPSSLEAAKNQLSLDVPVEIDAEDVVEIVTTKLDNGKRPFENREHMISSVTQAVFRYISDKVMVVKTRERTAQAVTAKEDLASTEGEQERALQERALQERCKLELSKIIEESKLTICRPLPPAKIRQLSAFRTLHFEGDKKTISDSNLYPKANRARKILARLCRIGLVSKDLAEYRRDAFWTNNLTTQPFLNELNAIINGKLMVPGVMGAAEVNTLTSLYQVLWPDLLGPDHRVTRVGLSQHKTRGRNVLIKLQEANPGVISNELIELASRRAPRNSINKLAAASASRSE